jgi:predicted ferric reductase
MTESFWKPLDPADFPSYGKCIGAGAAKEDQMTITAIREQGQSQASADALEVYMEASRAASEARCEAQWLAEQLRKARKAVKAAEQAEADALRAYESTPYAE